MLKSGLSPEAGSNSIGRPALVDHSLYDEVAAIERQQPLPVPLRSVAIIDRSFREGEAVVGAGIYLDLVVRSLHAGDDLVDDLLRRVAVGFGTGKIKFSLCLARSQMRAVGLVGGQLNAVDRSRCLDAIRENASPH